MDGFGYGPLVAALIALLFGLAAGKAWERYKLQEGRWIDRRKARESPHYMQGLNFLVSSQLDLAIDEISQAAKIDSDALEIHMILGNLYREKGQVGRAVQIHQQLLQRPSLRSLERTYVQLCLGLDYKRGGFVDRAIGAFNEVLRLDPQNEHALLHLERLYEDQHQWDEARSIRERLAKIVRPSLQARHQAIQAFLENELGLQANTHGNHADAIRHFRAAIDLDSRVVPAYLNLGDVTLARGDAAGAAEIWERVVSVAPERAYLAFARLEGVYRTLDAPARFEDLCRTLIAGNPQDWRARLALARHLRARTPASPSEQNGQPDAAVLAGADRTKSEEALALLLDALAHNPHAVVIHQTIWETLLELGLTQPLVNRYSAISREAVFYSDPHICIRCRYRSNELLWQCPHCHEWNTFVEERIAPAQDGEEAEG